MLTGVEVLPSLGESDFQDKNETVKDFRHYIFAIINRTRDSPIRFRKSKLFCEKENRPQSLHTQYREKPKNSRLSADLSSYHEGALPGGRVENPLSQAQ
jgi:hypothetical protein